MMDSWISFLQARRWFNALRAGPGARRSVTWLGALFIVAMAALACYDSLRSYRQAVQDTGRALDAQARVIAEQTARSVQAVDVVLRHLAEQQRSGAFKQLNGEQLHTMLAEQAVGLVQADGLAMHDAQGRALALSWLYPTPFEAASAADRAAFRTMRDDPRGDVYIGGAVRSRVDDTLFFPIARRLTTASGDFAGTVAARGRIDYFQQFYRDAQPDPATKVTLMHRNSTLLARKPPVPDSLGQRFPVVEELLAAAATGQTPTRRISPVDGVERFGAVRLVPDYPLMVVVTRDTDAALAPWRHQALGSLLRTLALATLAALLLVVARRQLARLDAARSSLETSRERYALAAAGSDDGLWDWDLVAGSAFESARARELQGLPPGPETLPLHTLQAELQYHPDDAALRRDTMAAHLAGQTPAYEVEYRVRHADGVYRWIRVRGLCTRDAAGKPLRIAGSVSDIDARKRAEVALRTSEERYAMAMTGSHEGHWVWDLVTRQVFVSATQAELLALPGGAQMMADETYFGSIPLHPEDHERVHRNRNEHVAGKTARLDHEFRIVLPGSGELRWMHTRGQCFRDAAGRPHSLAGATVDITERKRTEQALRDSEERFALAVAGSNDGVLDWDIVNDRMFTSARAMQIGGVQADAMVRTRAEWTALLQVHPDDVQRHAEDFRRHLSGQSDLRDGEYRVRHPDGSYRWVRVRGMLIRDPAGKPVRWAGSVTDIDAQKRTEEALRRSEERYQLAIDGSNQGLWDWDLASDMIFMSPRAQELVWLTPGETLRPRLEWVALSTYHPDDLKPLLQAMADHLEGRTPLFIADYRLRNQSGEWIWYRQRGIAVRDAQGRPTRVAGSMENISAHKNAEAARDRLEVQLRQAQKLEAIGTLAGGIAHDFNNILSAILGYGELAQKDAAEGTPLRRHLDAALSAGQRAKSLVERILAFSRSGMGERVPVHVQSVLVEALDAVAASLPPGVLLQRSLNTGDAGVLGDPTQIHQVVMNLCANAVQAMKGEGRLTVSADVLRLDQPINITTSSLTAGDYVRLRISDTGMGMTPQLLERIFDPFFTTKEVGVGTGLGLSLVHGIATDLGGGVAVESAPGQGASFTVYLPWQRHVAAPAQVAQPIAAGEGETILLVDDEEALVRLGEETLAELGYEPVGFSSSTAALQAFQAAPDRFHAVLTDEAMPGLTGSELIAEIRRQRPALPIVLMSGFVSPALQARAREHGVAEVLAKPLVSRDIAQALAHALRNARPSGRN